MSVNKVILIGNLGKDPEVRQWDNGDSQATFSLACSEKGYKLRNGTDVPDHTEWFNIVMRNKLSEVASKFLHKGDKVYIEGKLKNRTYEDKNGQTRYFIEVLATSIDFLTPKGSNNQGTSNGGYQGSNQTSNQTSNQGSGNRGYNNCSNQGGNDAPDTPPMSPSDEGDGGSDLPF